MSVGCGYFDVRPVGLDHTERGHGFVFQALRARAGSVIPQGHSLSRKGSKEVLTQRLLDFLGATNPALGAEAELCPPAWPRLDEEAHCRPPGPARTLQLGRLFVSRLSDREISLRILQQ